MGFFEPLISLRVGERAKIRLSLFEALSEISRQKNQFRLRIRMKPGVVSPVYPRDPYAEKGEICRKCRIGAHRFDKKKRFAGTAGGVNPPALGQVLSQCVKCLRWRHFQHIFSVSGERMFAVIAVYATQFKCPDKVKIDLRSRKFSLAGLKGPYRLQTAKKRRFACLIGPVAWQRAQKARLARPCGKG